MNDNVNTKDPKSAIEMFRATLLKSATLRGDVHDMYNEALKTLENEIIKKNEDGSKDDNTNR